MKKLTAGIFTAILAVITVAGANAETVVASTQYVTDQITDVSAEVDEVRAASLAKDQTVANANKILVTDAQGVVGMADYAGTLAFVKTVTDDYIENESISQGKIYGLTDDLAAKQAVLEDSATITVNTDGNTLSVVTGAVDKDNNALVTGAAVRAAIDDATSGIATSGAMDALSARVKTIEDDYATDTDLGALDTRVGTAESEIDTLQGQIGGIATNATAIAENKAAIAAIEIPAKTSELTNDSGFITAADVPADDTSWDARLDAIEADYATNTNLTAAVGRITTAESEIDTLQTQITGIATNAADIAANETAIAENKAAIAAIEIPAKTSELTNDSGFITAADVPADDTSWDARLDTIEADYVKNAQLTTVSESVTANATKIAANADDITANGTAIAANTAAMTMPNGCDATSCVFVGINANGDSVWSKVVRERTAG